MSDGLYGFDCMVKKQSEVLSDQTNTETVLLQLQMQAAKPYN
jgi:hypothetical protein